MTFFQKLLDLADRLHAINNGKYGVSVYLRWEHGMQRYRPRCHGSLHMIGAVV